MKYWLNKDPTVKIRIYRKKGIKFLHVSDLSLNEVAAIINQMENALRDSYGGGEYNMKLVDLNGHLLAQYEYAVAGPVKDNGDNADRPGTRRNSPLELMMVEFLKGKMSEDPTASLLANLQALKAITGDNEYGKELMSVMANNFITSKENEFDRLAKMMEVAKSMVPIQSEDSTVALLTAGLPVLGALLQRGAPGNAPAQAASQLQEMTPPSGLAQTALETTAEDRDPTQDRIDQIRQEIVAGADPQHVADRLLLLVRTEAFCCAFDGSQPHPALAGMVIERDPLKLSAAYDAFCEAVPELAGDPDLKNKVGHALAARVMEEMGAEPEEAGEEAEPAELEEVRDDTDHEMETEEVYDAGIQVSGGDSEAAEGQGDGAVAGSLDGHEATLDPVV